MKRDYSLRKDGETRRTAMKCDYYWSGDKAERAEYARIHTKDMEERFSEEITTSIVGTKMYDDKSDFSIPPVNPQIHVSLDVLDSVSAIEKHADGRTAVLNFASYKEPGGRFMDGSRAQEESLCAESFLYNVLSVFSDYYEWNGKHKNVAMYENRALYSPKVRFESKGQEKYCDVITCAAPNITPSRKYGWGITDKLNSRVLEERVEFVVKIAADRKVDTLILGAWGCGVFGQNPEEVCRLFVKYINAYPVFKKVIFSIPKNIDSDNYEAFRKTLTELYGKGSVGEA